MLTFKQLLKEELAWTGLSTTNFVFRNVSIGSVLGPDVSYMDEAHNRDKLWPDKSEYGYWIPLSRTMWSRVREQQQSKLPDRIESLHILGIENLGKLKGLEGRKVGLSTFTGYQTQFWGSPSDIFDGVQAGAGVVARLDAEPIFRSEIDLMSIPVPDGTRWVHSGAVFDGALGTNNKSFTQDVTRELNNIRSKYGITERWEDIYSGEDPSILQLLVKEYFDTMETVLKSNFRNIGENKEVTEAPWDEAIVTDINVKKLYVHAELVNDYSHNDYTSGGLHDPKTGVELALRPYGWSVEFVDDDEWEQKSKELYAEVKKTWGN